MNILIIGGTNFIGPPVIRHLINMGHEVTVFHRGKTQTELPEQVHHLLGDRRDLNDFKSTFEQLAPEVVLDMFAYTKDDAQILMKSFRGIARRVVVISSIDVYRVYDVLWGRESNIIPVPLTEDSPLRSSLYPFREIPYRPLNAPADYEKILVEQVVMSDPELPGTIVRLPMVYGTNDPLRRLFPYLQRIKEQRPVIVLEESIASWRGSYGYVENVAFAIALAVTNEKAKNRVYHVAEKEALSESERIAKIGDLAGWKGKISTLSKEKMPSDWKLVLNTKQDWLVDSSRIREELGYQEIIPMNKALKSTLEWERNCPPEKPENFVTPWLLDYVTEDKLATKSLD
ncbi:NAD-dependent epimerase/dehydratase family protein [Mastigocoleus testarum]|uniref:NAD-dependent dehydratase n=1 Tax=Mastigocoleus testarum BC008 TaxID=371196 RepID=A0A0V7ZPH7_9CYAN|nr:NAD-dependent epimerase/dehydratase family protein [Mastigocoleus testarum]KST66531.1 NAD-dependent dehydratase [Mastigocoleus testarum BC008]